MHVVFRAAFLGFRSTDLPDPSVHVRVPFQRRDMRIHDALEEFLLQLEANGRSEHTRLQYRRHISSLIAWLAPEENVAGIMPTALARFLASPTARETKKGRERKPGSVNALRGSLKGFGSFLHEAGYLPSNPGRLI